MSPAWPQLEHWFITGSNELMIASEKNMSLTSLFIPFYYILREA